MSWRDPRQRSGTRYYVTIMHRNTFAEVLPLVCVWPKNSSIKMFIFWLSSDWNLFPISSNHFMAKYKNIWHTGRPCSSPSIFSWNSYLLSGHIPVELVCMGDPSSIVVALPDGWSRVIFGLFPFGFDYSRSTQFLGASWWKSEGLARINPHCPF